MSLLPKRWSEALESIIKGPDECERQVEALPVWATDEMNAYLAA